VVVVVEIDAKRDTKGEIPHKRSCIPFREETQTRRPRKLPPIAW